jgi:hypothetical protein
MFKASIRSLRELTHERSPKTDLLGARPIAGDQWRERNVLHKEDAGIKTRIE